MCHNFISIKLFLPIPPSKGAIIWFPRALSHRTLQISSQTKYIWTVFSKDTALHTTLHTHPAKTFLRLKNSMRQKTHEHLRNRCHIEQANSKYSLTCFFITFSSSFNSLALITLGGTMSFSESLLHLFASLPSPYWFIYSYIFINEFTYSSMYLFTTLFQNGCQLTHKNT